jgi:hypothetical protein
MMEATKGTESAEIQFNIDQHGETEETENYCFALWFSYQLTPFLRSSVLSTSVVENYSAVSVASVLSAHCTEKFTVTVMMTGTGTPLRYVGVNSH